MNLTKWFAAGLCLTAMTVSAGFIKTNAFEDGESDAGWFFGDKSWNIEGVRVANDSVNGRGDYTGSRPLPDAANSKVLKLDTEGGIWTNVVDQSFLGAPVWVDMLVKFVPSEELPALTEVKLALAIKAGANGTNYLNFAANSGGPISWTETAQEISTSAWYRVTVKMYYTEDVGTFAQLSINGTALGDPITLDFNTTLNSIGFQGTGYIDEVTVSDSDPIVTSVMLMLSFTAGTDIASVLVGGNPKNSGDTVASGSELIITAAQWKEVASVTGPDDVDFGASAAGDSCVTVTVSHASATNVYITAQNQTSTELLTGTTFTNAPISTVATWAIANEVSEAALTSDMYDRYLFNIAEDATVPTMLITSISVSGSTVTVTVTAGASNLKTGINGTLKIKSYATLGATPTVRTIEFVGATTDTITCDIGTDKFVKASVE